MHPRLLLLSAAVLLAGAAPATVELPRTTVFGVSGTPQKASDGSAGVRVDTVAGELTGAKLGLKAGDVVTEINGMSIADMGGFAAAAGKIEANRPVRMTIWRGGKRRQLTATSVGRPLEVYRNGAAHYSAVPFRGGLLREVLVTPPGGATGPVVFLVQGYTCDSFETTREDSPHRLLFDGLLARGISVYRIEKPQAGDSRGGPACRDIDFATEMAAFEAGYRTLMGRHGIAADRVFLLGHSMGGVQAPLLASRVVAPRGVAAYGTVTRNWQDYIFNLYRVQGFTGAGADPAEGEALSEALRPVLYAFFAEAKTPAAIAAANPAHDKLLRETLEWDGDGQIMNRHYRYWQGLAKERLVAAWRDTRANVLSVYGESDIAALDNQDHRFIADVVNHYRPGTARFVEVPRTGHGMTVDGSMDQVRASRRAGSQQRPAFNPDLVAIFGDWIEATMREPAVSTRFPAKEG